jgi:L-fuculose-phosphate aldolase
MAGAISMRERVAAASRKLAAAGLVVGTAGNVSERSRELVAITATGVTLAEMTAAHVTVVGLDGSRVEGEFAPASEIELHLGIYRHAAASAVVHTHSPFATALSTVLDELPCIHYQMMLLGGPVRVAPYEVFGSPELAAGTVEALAGRQAALMASHGAVATGQDLDAAVGNALLLEWACELYWRAAAIGTPRALGEDELAAVAQAVAARRYGEPKASA